MLEAFPATAPVESDADRYRQFLVELLAGRVEASALVDDGPDFSLITSGDDVTAYRAHGGVHVGDYFAETQGDHQLANAIALALARNEGPARLVMPMGHHVLTRQLTEADGIRSGITFDGLDPQICRMRREGNGQMFLLNEGGLENVWWRNMGFDYPSALQNGDISAYNTSITVANGIGCGIANCHFTADFAEQTANGIYHQVQMRGGKDNKVIGCYLRGAQVRLSSVGFSSDGNECTDCSFEDCNDYGISCVSGGDGHFVRNIRILRNKFRNLRGAGFIYVGADSNPGTPNPDMSDVWVDDNQCFGSILTEPFSNGSRTGIRVALGNRNLRIRLRRNIIYNDNPDVDAAQVWGIAVTVKNDEGESTEDLVVADNATDLRSNDAREGVLISAWNGTGVRVERNTVRAGARGIRVENCSNVRLIENDVLDSTTHACTIGATRNDVSDIAARGNLFRTTASFKAAILFAGEGSISRATIGGRNRLLAASNGYSVLGQNEGSLSFRYLNNTANVALHSGTVPDEDSGNVLEE